MRHGLIEPGSVQQMLYEALDQSDDIVLVAEQAGRDSEDLIIAAANGAFCRATELTHQELIGRTLRSLAQPNTAADHWVDLANAVRRNTSARTELLLNRKSGAAFWFGLHLMAVRDEAVRRFVIVGRDITERLRTRQHEAAVQGLLAKVFLCVKAPVAIISDTGTIQMANPALDELLGHTAGALLGKPSIDYVATSVQPALLAARQHQMESGEDFTIPTRLLHADGHEEPCEITSIIVHRDDLRRFRIVTVLKQPHAPITTLRVAGKVKLIGLDAVKEALGPRWPDVAARAMASAEHVVQRRCGPHDTYSRTADAGFLICFADASEEEAAFRAAALAREIRNRLIGEGESDAVATVSAIAATVEVPNLPGQSPDILAALISERLNSRLAEIEAKAREALRLAAQTARCQLEPVRSLRTREVVAHFARLPPQLERRILAAYSSLSLSERQNFDFDRLVLGTAAELAIAELAAGDSQLILVNVDFEVFLDRRRTDRYVAACQQLDDRLRQRLLLVLFGMPKGVPKSRLMDCMMRLRPFCHGLALQLDKADVASADLSSLGVSLIVMEDGWRSPAEVREIEKLAKTVDSLHAQQARVLVRHVGSWLEAKPLARIGVDLISVARDEHDASGA